VFDQEGSGFGPRLLPLVDVAVSGAKDKTCSVITPLKLLEDLCDCSVLEDCRIIFKYMEDMLEVWNSVSRQMCLYIPMADADPFALETPHALVCVGGTCGCRGAGDFSC
jgi:hypothetical protein